MSDQTLVACPHCQKRYRIQVLQSKVVQCSQCQKKFKVHPPQALVAQVASQPEVVATVVQPPLQSRRTSSVRKPPQSTGMSTGVKLLIAGLVVGFLVLAVGLLALLLYRNSSEPIANRTVPADAGAAEWIPDSSDSALAPNFDSARSFEKAAPASPSSRTRSAPNGSRSNDSIEPFRSAPTPPATKRATAVSTSVGEIAYDFVEGRQYTFRYDFETELGKNKVLKMSGSNFLTKLPRGDLPIKVGEFGNVSGGKKSGGNTQVLQSRAYAMTEMKNNADPHSYSSPQHQDFEGVIELDDAGQPKASKGRLKQNLLPCLLMPMSRLGLETLPPNGTNGTKKWEVENDLVTVRFESPEPGNQFGAFPGSRFGGLPGYSPYGRPTQNVPDATICTMKRNEKLEVVSNDANQMRVTKTISIKPEEKSDNEAPQLSLEASGYYVFDKQKKCVVESEITGTAEISSENVTVKIPVKFTSKLDSIKTKEELAADRKKREADRKKKNEELAAKRKASAATSETASVDKLKPGEPRRFKAEEAQEGRVPNQMVAEFPDLGWGVDSLDFSPRGILYAGKMDRAILVFNIKKRRQIDERTKLEDLGQVKVSKVTPDGKYLLTGGYSGRIDVWKLKNDGTLKEGEAFAGHAKEIKSIAISDDSKLAISGGSDKRARLWDIETCKEIAAFDGFERAVLASYIAQDKSYALVSDGYNLMKIDLATNKMVSNPKVFNSYPHAAAFTPDGKKLAISEGYNVHLIDTSSFVEEVVLQGPRKIHYGLAFDKTGKYLFAGGGHITQWDWEKGKALNEYHFGDHATIRAIAITDDGEHLASIGSSAGQDLRVFKIRNGSGDQ